MSWLKNAIHQTTKPKNSIIGVLKLNLGGPRHGRSMEVLHASDVTNPEFCPRRWAFFDILEKSAPHENISTALDVTFQMGTEAERLFVEEWGGEAVIGNWQCRHCGEQRSMVPKPNGYCKTPPQGAVKKHWWAYRQVVVETPEYGIQGGIDALFSIGAPQLVITEVKTLNPTNFDSMVAPLPEHRLRTNLYMKIIAESLHPHKEKINTQEARVVYISRGYGKLNAEWNEILPFREFIVKRNDLDLSEFLKRAKALKRFREQQVMPPGICATALDKIAKGCAVCQPCFSGQYPAEKVLA